MCLTLKELKTIIKLKKNKPNLYISSNLVLRTHPFFIKLIKEKNIRIMPTSPEIRKFIKKHKEFKELLPIGVRL